LPSPGGPSTNHARSGGSAGTWTDDTDTAADVAAHDRSRYHGPR
jgi:hypothetical protein